MSRRDERLDAVLCHCHGIEHASGHPLGSTGCEASVKAASLPRWGTGLVGGSGGQSPRTGACGTCPKCGQRARVVRIETHGVTPGMRSDRIRRGGPSVVDIRPAMAQHKHAGQDCPGAGQVPVETRHASGRELAGFIKDYGAERLVER